MAEKKEPMAKAAPQQTAEKKEPKGILYPAEELAKAAHRFNTREVRQMAAKVIKIEIPIETQDKTDPALGSVTAKMEDLDNAAKNAQKSMDSASKSASGFEKSLGKSMDNVSKKASGFEKSLGSVTKQKWQILLEAKDKITPTVKQAITYVKSLSSKA